MTKRERVIASIKGKEVDCVPTSFSLHFPEAAAMGDEAVETHLRFFEDTDTDICKIMNENLVPSMGEIRTPEEFEKFHKITIQDEFMQNQLNLARKIKAKCDQEIFLVGTMHGIVASTIHPLQKAGIESVSARFFLRDCLRKNSEPVLRAMDRVADGMCELAKGYMEVGLDGVYYAALGGETWIFTDIEFETWIKPFDLKIMKGIKDAGGTCILHICKEGLNMNRYREYTSYADIINWGVFEAPCTLADGKKLFTDKAIMGGLANRRGVMVSGTLESLKEETQRIIRETGKKGFVLGADCTLPTEIEYERIRTIVDAAREV